MKWKFIFGILFAFIASSDVLAQKPSSTVDLVKELPAYGHFFENGANKVMFKSVIELGREKLSGLLLIKAFPEGEFISVFTTETGFKIFEIGFSDNGFTLKYGIGPLKKKMIAKRLAMTVQVLTIRQVQENRVVVNREKNKPVFVISRLVSKGYINMTVNDSYQVIDQVFLTKSMKLKASSIFSNFNTHNIPDSAHVMHVGFPLQGHFRRLSP
ncbi:MAG: hypothetical protein MH137_14550 [Flavobacteriales bacterium]|nr:hypothetical protein [Flavobacteriales bacterium]